MIGGSGTLPVVVAAVEGTGNSAATANDPVDRNGGWVPSGGACGTGKATPVVCRERGFAVTAAACRTAASSDRSAFVNR